MFVLEMNFVITCLDIRSAHFTSQGLCGKSNKCFNSVIEVRDSLAGALTEGFYNCMEDLKTKNNFVVYPGQHVYKNSHGVEFTPLIDFLSKRLKQVIKQYREISKYYFDISRLFIL